MRFNMVLACSLLISACAAGDESSQNSTENGQAESDYPPAGLYEETATTEFIGAGTPPMPVEPQTSETCYPDGPEKLLATSGMNCTDEEVRIGDGEVSARKRCTWPGAPGQEFPFALQGSYDAEGAELTGDMQFPQGTIRTTRKIRRIGNC